MGNHGEPIGETVDSQETNTAPVVIARVARWFGIRLASHSAFTHLTGADMDITSALAASGPTERVGKCLLQRRLDGIPDEVEGKGDLIDAIESSDWSAPMLAKVFMRLGLTVSVTIIRQHRAGTCSCFIGG